MEGISIGRELGRNDDDWYLGFNYRVYSESHVTGLQLVDHNFRWEKGMCLLEEEVLLSPKSMLCW